MSRSADYTIQGFLYQFNKTVLEILKALDGDTITVEGIVEDIDVASQTSLTAIQCKYHEASTSFTPSSVYKPLLQMLKHFSDHPDAGIRYVLFAHFPSAGSPPPAVDKSTLQAALVSKDKSLQGLIKAIPSSIALDEFEACFVMEFGPSYDNIAKQVADELAACGMPTGDIETLAYPNAIQKIATLSMKHDPKDRKITKKQFMSDLKAIHTTAISRWTLALKSRRKLLEWRRKQLKVHLDKNSRLRFLVLNPSDIEDYNKEIVLFTKDYIDKYHSKRAHINTPVLCIRAKKEQIDNVQLRLFKRGVIAEVGYVGGEFQESHFFREPMISKKAGSKIEREFDIRLLSWEHQANVLSKKEIDDLFVIGDIDLDSLDTVDVNVELLTGVTLKEAKYIMGISNVYE